MIGDDAGDLITDTSTYTPGADGTATYDEVITWSYGDPSSGAPGTTLSSTTAGGGSGSFEYNISATASGITFKLDEDETDTSNLNDLVAGPSFDGTWSDVETDSFDVHDSVTYNDDGTASDSFESDSSHKDLFNLGLSGSDSAGNSFAITDKGNDSSSYHDEGSDAAGGGGNDDFNEDDTSSETKSLTDSGTGLSASTTSKEDLGYHEKGGSSQGAGGAGATSNDQVTGTDDGNDSTSFDDSTTIGGAPATLHETTDDTYDDTVTNTSTGSGGTTTTTKSEVDDSTNNEDDHVAISGVDDGPGYGWGYGSGSDSGSGSGSGSAPSDTNDGEDITHSSKGTSRDTINTAPDASGAMVTNQEIVDTGNSSENDSGTDPGGPFSDSSSGNYSIDMTFRTDASGTAIIGDVATNSPPNGTSTGTPPGNFGGSPLANDVAMAGEMASYGPMMAASAATAQVAQGTAKPAPPPPKAPAPPPPPGTVTGTNVNDATNQAILRMGGVDANFKQTVLAKKQTTLKNIGAVKGPLHVGVGGGQYAIIPKLPPGYTAGSTGAGPCIGVIISSPNGHIYVYHFNNNQNPARTMFQTRTAPYPAGSTAIIFGGDNSKESNFTLGSVVTYLSANAVNYNYSNTTGANVDSTGTYFLFLKDGNSPE